MRRRSRASSKSANARNRKPAKRRTASKDLHRPGSSAGHKAKVARLTRERDEALERETATAELLKVISSSPGELEPVFQAMLENATRICEATSGLLVRAENDGFRIAASLRQRADIEDMKHRTFKFGPSTPIGRAVRSRQIVHVPNLSEDRAYLEREPLAVWAVEQAKVRTVLVVPMLKREELVGVFGIERDVVSPFTDKQIALVTNFAAQAVIAIENARLLSELRQRTTDLGESLEQQTATSELLGVISRSSGDLSPVFESVLANAIRVCGAKFGGLFLCEGDAVRVAAFHNAPNALAELWRREPLFRPGPRLGLSRSIRSKQVVQIADFMADQAYHERDPARMQVIELGGFRASLSVPLVKDDEAIGVFNIWRQEPGPFADRQITVATNFANQAVIAIENTRLFNELRQRTDELSHRTDDLSEALEQQTATSEVLKVISSSPDDLKPVFEAMLTNATRLCEAKFGVLFRSEGDAFRCVALHNAPPLYAEMRQREPVFRPPPTTAIGRAAATRQAVQIADAQLVPGYFDVPQGFTRTGVVSLAGARTVLAVPMLKENELVGAIVIYRQEVRPFTNKQVELVTNFAAQAVIAIENTRLLNELRQSLEQQTATADVLRIISSSPGELEPVFQAMLENAARVCEAKFGMLFRLEDGAMRPVGSLGVPQPLVEFFSRGPALPAEDAPIMRVVKTKQPAHVVDFATERAYIERNPVAVAGVELGGVRTLLVVPMLKESELIGAFAIYRQEVRPFTDKQIALVQNFAAQAVIAIENARLLNELRQRTADLSESLEQQTAISEILRVISNSPSDVQPVLDTVARHAARICEARVVDILIAEKNVLRGAASFGSFGELGRLHAGELVPLDRTTVMGRSICDMQPVHVTDQQNAGDELPLGRELAIRFGHRTILGVPLIREGRALGTILVRRAEVRPFEQKHIDLLTTFADQAAIAIENVRLFEAEQQRSRELAELFAATDGHCRRAQDHQPFDVRSAGSTANPR